MTVNELQDLVDEVMWLATAQLFSESLSVLLAWKDNVSNTEVAPNKGLNMFDFDRKYSVWIGGSILSSLSTFRRMRISKHHEV